MGCCWSTKASRASNQSPRGRLFFNFDQKSAAWWEERRQNIMATNKTHFVQQIIDKADFDNRLKEAGPKLVIVDFFATWCGPCKTFSPEVEKLAETMSDVIFLKVDVDDCEELAGEYSINCMPTFVAILEGKTVGTMSGANLEKLKKLITDHKK